MANIAVEMRSWEALFLLRFFDLRVMHELRIFLLIITRGLFTQLLIERFFSWGGRSGLLEKISFFQWGSGYGGSCGVARGNCTKPLLNLTRASSKA